MIGMNFPAVLDENKAGRSKRRPYVSQTRTRALKIARSPDDADRRGDRCD